MIQSQLYLCAVPSQLWDFEAELPESLSILQGLIRDALAIERRLSKDVNLENERARYILCCNQIENMVSELMLPFKTVDEFHQILKSGRFPSFTIDDTYIHFLMQVALLETEEKTAAQIRLGASFFSPKEIVGHSEGFEQLAQKLGWHDKKAILTRIGFFRSLAGATGCGVVEIQNPLLVTQGVNTSPGAFMIKPPDRPIALPSSAIVDEVITGSRRTRMAQQLHVQVDQALKMQQTVNLSNQPHDITTEVLHDFVYSKADIHQTSMRIVYADGSEAEPFPLRCLPERHADQIRSLEALSPLRIALISMRHLELDRVVDIAWFRNREASQSRTLSEADRFCYEYSVKQFRDLAALADESNGIVIHLYHTGFEPAVTAFYRAFVNMLLEQGSAPPKILIIPHYYRGINPYERGCPWA
jgi:hypothetical protein